MKTDILPDRPRFIDKHHIYDEDFYYPFELKDGSVNKKLEIFEFCMDKKNCRFEPEDVFYLVDITDTFPIKYMVLSIGTCAGHSRAVRLKCVFLSVMKLEKATPEEVGIGKT